MSDMFAIIAAIFAIFSVLITLKTIIRSNLKGWPKENKVDYDKFVVKSNGQLALSERPVPSPMKPLRAAECKQCGYVEEYRTGQKFCSKCGSNILEML